MFWNTAISTILATTVREWTQTGYPNRH